MEVDDQLSDIEKKIAEIRKEYELFFAGDRRIPPERLRNQIRLALVKLASKGLTSTGRKFRLSSLTARFNSNCRYWDRIMMQIELGTYKPDKFKADIRVGTISKDSGKVEIAPDRVKKRFRLDKSAEAEDRDIKNLFNTFIEIRRVTGENVNIDYDSFRKSIVKNKEILKEKAGDNYEFKVLIENGKAKVKGKIK